jgi:hypothetical protein
VNGAPAARPLAIAALFTAWSGNPQTPGAATAPLLYAALLLLFAATLIVRGTREKTIATANRIAVNFFIECFIKFSP